MNYKILGLCALFPAGLMACDNKAHSPASDVKTDTVSKNTPVVITDSIKQNAAVKEEEDSTASEFKLFTRYTVKDSIEADLNGDNVAEKAFFKQTADERNLFIIDGRTKELIKIGSDASFKDLGDDFNWVDYWGITRDSETFEVLVEDDEVTGGRNVKLKYPSLFVRKEEVGGGMITWSGKAYKWIHQAD